MADKQPHYIFEFGLTQGINAIPLSSLVSIKDTGEMFILTEKTGLTSASTVYDAMAISANEKFGKSLAGPEGPQGVQGPVGPEGAQGPQGDTGPAGTQGLQGVTGPTGLTGQAGTKGDTGTTGPQGPTGNNGAQGLTGLQGVQGAQGEQGVQGEQGIVGEQGAGVVVQGTDTVENIKAKANVVGHMWITVDTGVDDQANPVAVGDGMVTAGSAWITVGPMRGPEGQQGATGTQGIQGVQGLTGDTGAEGPQGIQGTQGLPGNDGATGPAGDTGPQGIQGIDGPQGPTGSTGIQGPAGNDGVDGATGPQGIQGPIGNTGNTGAQGPIGPEGKSAYAVAVEEGYSGTEAQWLASLVGPEGPDGPQGIDGPQGPTGTTGDTGPQGVDGIQGPKGDTGDTGPAGSDATVEFASQVEADAGILSSKAISPATVNALSRWDNYYDKTSMDSKLEGKVQKTGDTMSGTLQLIENSTANIHINVGTTDFGGIRWSKNNDQKWLLYQGDDADANLIIQARADDGGLKSALSLNRDTGVASFTGMPIGNNSPIVAKGFGWVRFADGTQITYARYLTMTYQDQQTNYFGTTSGNSPRASLSYTFPVAFNATPTVTMSGVGFGTVGLRCLCTNGASCTFYACYLSGQSPQISYIAIGTWK